MIPGGYEADHFDIENGTSRVDRNAEILREPGPNERVSAWIPTKRETCSWEEEVARGLLVYGFKRTNAGGCATLPTFTNPEKRVFGPSFFYNGPPKG